MKAADLSKEAKNLKKGIYKHFKGNKYEVLSIALHSETLEEVVVYKNLYNHKKYGKNRLWIRPLKMFLEKVKVNGKKAKRFNYIGDK
jgi:hypothetical protein